MEVKVERQLPQGDVSLISSAPCNKWNKLHFFSSGWYFGTRLDWDCKDNGHALGKVSRTMDTLVDGCLCYAQFSFYKRVL